MSSPSAKLTDTSVTKLNESIYKQAISLFTLVKYTNSQT